MYPSARLGDHRLPIWLKSRDQRLENASLLVRLEQYVETSPGSMLRNLHDPQCSGDQDEDIIPDVPISRCVIGCELEKRPSRLRGVLRIVALDV
jgi:hypothetical protein